MPAPMERLTTASALAAATREPPRTNRIIPPPKKKLRHTMSYNTSTSSPSFEKRLSSGKSNEIVTRTDSTPGISGAYSKTNASQTVISFAPSFLSSQSLGIENSKDQVEEDNDAQLRFPRRVLQEQGRLSSLNSQNTSQLVSNRSKQRRTHVGLWEKRLHALRNANMSDAIRLFHPDNFVDWNNPRHKSTSHTDLTIIGDPNKIASKTALTMVEEGNHNSLQHHKVHILCLVHNHVQKDEGCMIPAIASVTNDSDVSTSKIPQAPFYSWVTFQKSTSRSISLQRGQQLRVYNAQLIPCRSDTIIHMPTKIANHFAGDCHRNMSTSCRHILICTELCELYSNEWPPLTTRNTFHDMSSAPTPLGTQLCDDEVTALKGQ